MLGLIVLFISVVFFVISKIGFDDFEKQCKLQNTDDPKKLILFIVCSAILGLVTYSLTITYFSSLFLTSLDKGLYYAGFLFIFHCTMAQLFRFLGGIKKRYISNVFLVALSFTIIFWFTTDGTHIF